MSYLLAVSRRRELKKMESSAEWNLHIITQARSAAKNSVNDLMQVGTEYENDSKVAKRIEARRYQLKVYEEKLDQQKANLEDQLKEIRAELQSCEETIQKHLESAFHYKVG